MCKFILQVPQVELLFNKHVNNPSAPQGGEPFKRSKQLKQAALAYLSVARKAAFFNRGPSAQPRGAQLKLEFHDRSQEGVGDITSQGAVSLSIELVVHCGHQRGRPNS
jgi:hypothetical protein